ncbi:MAG: thioredoxin-dependent thiol peroxidase [Chloroflexi bacterium]|nr:thioredoxin-dependent thiol peroxidase [Chloroflexota bacterium]
MPIEVEVGQPAPDFALPDENNNVHRLADYRGRPLLLYFYPEDDTPGCTKEACNFRDDYSAYQEAGVAILGVSPDNPKSHAKFKKKYDLPFSLLADENKELAEALGVWGEKTFMGKHYLGILRTTFLIDGEGRIARVFENVRPAEHSQEVLEAVKELG